MAEQTQRGGTDWLTALVVLGGGGLVLWGLGVFGGGGGGTPGVFTIEQPIVEPFQTTPGNKVKITCRIAMGEGDKFTGQVIIKVEEASVNPAPGDMLYQKVFNDVKFVPGETLELSFDWIASGSTNNWGNQWGSKDIEVFINKGSEGVDSHHFDDCIIVMPLSLNFYCLQPQVTPDNAPLGTTVQITCPVVSQCNGTVSARVRMQVAESSWLPSPGDILDTQVSPYQDINPGETKDFTFNHTTRGATGSKDILVYIEVEGQEGPGGNHFDDAFHVT